MTSIPHISVLSRHPESTLDTLLPISFPLKKEGVPTMLRSCSSAVKAEKPLNKLKKINKFKRLS